MCTGFFKKGNDLIYGFNLDVDPAVWDFSLHKTKQVFTVAIRVGGTVYYTHGINRDGHFSNLPYMNDPNPETRKAGRNTLRIDLLTDRYIRNQYSFEDVRRLVAEKTLVNVPKTSMHSLIGDAQGRVLLVEPRGGVREITDDHAVIGNFPHLIPLEDYSYKFYWKDAYDRAEQILSDSDVTFGAADGMRLLEAVKHDGKWGTRISFVYSQNEQAVYYCLNGDFSQIQKHYFYTR